MVSYKRSFDSDNTYKVVLARIHIGNLGKSLGSHSLKGELKGLLHDYVPNSHVPGGKSDGQRCLVSRGQTPPYFSLPFHCYRRGCPTLIWSVHGSNFVGAKKELILITP